MVGCASYAALFESRNSQQRQSNAHGPVSCTSLTLAATATLMLLLGARPAGALTATGVAVGSVTGTTQEGLPLVYRPLLDIGDFDGNAIKYFIPLGESSGTYGAGSSCGGFGFGACADSGDGGGKLTMILRFSPVSKTEPSTLRVLFEDLDLKNANDPAGFLEKLKIQAWTGTKVADLTPWITDIGGLVTGNYNTQQILELPLGILSTDPLYLLLNFKSQSSFYGTNTAEYLIAMVTSPNPAPPPPGEVPLPGAMALFGTVLAGSWGVRRWRRRSGRSKSL